MGKTGVILFNIGTPSSPNTEDVKKYLLRFLMDKDVIHLPYPLRWLLVHGIIVPRRAKASAEKYRKIWLKEGSPLEVYSKNFADKLQAELGSNYLVKIGMRYSEPSIKTAVESLIAEQVTSLLLVPMFPQYAEATTGSVLKEFYRVLKSTQEAKPSIQIVRDFFAHSSFVESSKKIILDTLKDAEVDHYLFSFHGLPESHIRKNKGCLISEDCCFEKSACEKPCYRAQCFASATQIAEALNLKPSHWSLSFQSRLGRGEWLKPSTDHTLEILAKTGKKNVAVISPSFVADCIETLEEIGIEARAHFKTFGGENLHLIPCLNADDFWVKQFAQVLKNFENISDLPKNDRKI